MPFVKTVDGKVTSVSFLPQVGHTQVNDDDAGLLEYLSPSPTADDVKAEAERRIIAIVPEWKQRNLLAQATILAEKGRTNWSSAELAAWTAGEGIWTQVSAIRAASDVIEALNPIPSDYAADSRWP